MKHTHDAFNVWMWVWVLAAVSGIMIGFGMRNMLIQTRYKKQVRSTADAVNYDAANGQFKVFVRYTHDGKEYNTSFLTPIPTRRGHKVVFYINPKNPVDTYWAKPSDGSIWFGVGILIAIALLVMIRYKHYSGGSARGRGRRAR